MSRYIRYLQITEHRPDKFDDIIRVAKSSYQFYWYIFHDKDKDENGNLKNKHLHIVMYDKSPSTLDKHAKLFEGIVPRHSLEACRNGRACIRYLIHKDDPEKFQYSINEVVTNKLPQLLSAIEDSDSVCSLYEDYERLRTAQISVGEFIQKYKQNLSSMNFYQQISTFNLLHKVTYKEN